MAVLKIFVGGFETTACGSGERIEVLAQILRKRCAGLDPLHSAGMGKAQFRGMEKLPMGSRYFGITQIKLTRGAIERVPDKRMLHSGEVHTDLMRSAGVGLDLEQRYRAKFGELVPFGAGLAAPDTCNSAPLAGCISECFHARSVPRITADWQVDSAGVTFKFALGERKVSFFYGAGAKRFRQSGVGIVVFCDDDQAGGLFVETVHDSRPECIRLRSTAGKILSATQKRVYKRATRVPCAGMDAHARRFVDDEQVVVFIDYVQRNGFRFRAKRRTLHNFYGDFLVAAKFV